MSRIKQIAAALMMCAALVNIAPVAVAAEPEVSDQHCFIIDHPAVCMVICTVQNQSPKPCGVGSMISCNPNTVPTLCYVLGEVWQIIP